MKHFILIIGLILSGCSSPVEPKQEEWFYAPQDFDSNEITSLYDVQMFCSEKGYNPNACLIEYEDGFSKNPIVAIRCSNHQDQRQRRSLTQ